MIYFRYYPQTPVRLSIRLSSRRSLSGCNAFLKENLVLIGLKNPHSTKGGILDKPSGRAERQIPPTTQHLLYIYSKLNISEGTRFCA